MLVTSGRLPYLMATNTITLDIVNQQTSEQTNKKVAEQTKPLANNVISLCEYKKMNKG
ncbi:hypothetical protein [Colwellia sp. TT2012]|uniref:hypothetical protein n=1 Tax=Colwellia sp. TT2012 TaxID=1720342 RepID=UPI000AB2A3C1|nr:hypothetical protein [Colwellia sp. TT2012]